VTKSAGSGGDGDGGNNNDNVRYNKIFKLL
jgi:hypothetical protein